MDKNESKKVIYSETMDVSGAPIDNQADNGNGKNLQESVKRLEVENQNIYANMQRIEEESALLRELFHNASNELSNLKKPALLVAEVTSMSKDKAIIKLPNGNKFYCYVSKELKDLKSGDNVLVDQKSLNVVEKIETTNNYDVERFVIMEKPQESWKDIGGLQKEIEEVKEVIELPLIKPELFKKVGINPPKGVLLYGPPGTGKTLLAKAVAHSTNAAFIEVIGSELVQKFIGEGAKLVKDIFSLARSKAPCIVFIDELDSLAATRMETGTSGEREVSRTFMQFLAEIDGFEALDNVKIIGATNRLDILDQAIIRPGRLDRLIEIGLPNEEGRMEILKVHTAAMTLKKVKLKEIAGVMIDFSGAEIRAVCTEAGYFAIRENREFVTQDDFLKAIEKVTVEDEDSDGRRMMG